VSDRLQEIRARLDAIKWDTIVGARWMRQVVADSVVLLYAVRERHGESDRLDEIAVRLAWWLQPPHWPKVAQPVILAQVRETVADARWLMAQLDAEDD
jgi:hypothetical protein